MMLMPRVMKGLEKSMTFSRSAVIVRPATARSAFWNTKGKYRNIMYTQSKVYAQTENSHEEVTQVYDVTNNLKTTTKIRMT